MFVCYGVEASVEGGGMRWCIFGGGDVCKCGKADKEEGDEDRKWLCSCRGRAMG